MESLQKKGITVGDRNRATKLLHDIPDKLKDYDPLPWHPLALMNKQEKPHNYPHHGLPKVESGEVLGERFWTRGTSLPRDRLTRGMPGDPGVGFQGGGWKIRLERTFSFSSFRGLQDRIAHPAYSIDSPARWRIKEIGISCLSFKGVLNLMSSKVGRLWTTR